MKRISITFCFSHSDNCRFTANVSFLGESFSDSEDFEDDIILTKAQKALIDNPHSALYHDGVDLQTSAAMVIWPENTVPYYVPPELGRDLCVFKLSWFASELPEKVSQTWWSSVGSILQYAVVVCV
jgi:hypothetical protein